MSDRSKELDFYDQEIIKMIERLDRKGSVEISADLLTEKFISKYISGLPDDDYRNRMFWMLFGRKGLRPHVSRILTKVFPGKKTDEKESFLPEHPRMQVRYQVERDGEPVHVATCYLTDDELDKIADELDAAQRGFAAHRDDVRRFLKDTELNDEGVRVFLSSGEPVPYPRP